jgi:hypothetical protein
LADKELLPFFYGRISNGIDKIAKLELALAELIQERQTILTNYISLA